MSNSADKKWLARQVTIALMAGAVSIVPQVAQGMPQGGEAIAGGATGISVPSGATAMNITSNATNNIIGWEDFSIQRGETVNFDNKNYLNLVRGKGSSFIDGTMTAGGGNIYLINPNGVIFGKTAEVNVGNLYVSTQERRQVRGLDAADRFRRSDDVLRYGGMPAYGNGRGNGCREPHRSDKGLYQGEPCGDGRAEYSLYEYEERPDGGGDGQS